MPDFSLDASREFWKSFDDPKVFEVISFMEKIESWTLDGNEKIESALDKLEEAMDSIAGIEIKNFDHLVYIGAYLKTSRVLRIMQELDSNNPGAASRLLSFAEGQSFTDKTAQLFIRRNLIFERLRLLSRVFNYERLEKIHSALEKCS
jgi:intracellular multiplication protein IcmW|tara:strand:- start:9451 stop:9894 length:444 start_codon:yes stop_codon:yes gene_type:complete